ncbi:MAG: hypothetical protein A2126_00075 [Candidatus Woykebacteria bacterium GWB1_45_5]|uniref:DUF3465 domain-containing protein n=2 Tax=Candidatus Woykeibacteriota TaxID=1817899 RepID=A0A1G1W3E5_9BACT|nr:MAG: hypothetical protein A2113_02755 [Candidatus Woykebacteria bacterium GWA1_44_8]OGY23270.1 MAG: hypothetical protein A2126_00075 [Candidatus Woykebacteria bacterium GWB1_45_5]
MTIAEALEKKISDVPVTVEGKAIEILEDDRSGEPHQRFIVQINSGQTILIAHNLEYAYRVPVKVGDRIEVHGTYEWNELGGVIHKTHHDDRGVHEDGWINFVGKKHPNFSKTP